MTLVMETALPVLAESKADMAQERRVVAKVETEEPRRVNDCTDKELPPVNSAAIDRKRTTHLKGLNGSGSRGDNSDSGGDSAAETSE